MNNTMSASASASTSDSAPASMKYGCFPTEELNEGFNGLSSEQKYAFAKFAQGQNVFITGPGGTGKTRLIQFMVDYMNANGRTHQVCALTGCAAVLLNCKAKTIHSWSGIRLAKGNVNDIVNRVIRNRCMAKNWKSIDVLIVDEVSMMSCKMFEILDQIGRAIRKNPGKPFGGIQLIFTGDFFQLPPIPDYDDPTSGQFCFQHSRWAATFKSADCIELRTFFRQTDPAYISILQEVRRGKITEASADLLEQRVNKRPAATKDGIVPTKLFPIRTKVDYINDTQYSKLGGDERIYQIAVKTNVKTRIDSGNPLTFEETARCEELTQEQLSREVDSLISALTTEKVVRLKIGALVMCSANLDVERGICNGSQGVIVDFAETILQEDLAQKTVIVPVVRFVNGVTMRITPHPRQSEEYPCIVVSHIPLCLAWALTIHKIQGATLDMAEMDIGKTVFADGQSYVALSRVKTLDGLYLSEFNPLKIKANPLVAEFYDTFPAIPESDMTALTHQILSRLTTTVAMTAKMNGLKQSHLGFSAGGGRWQNVSVKKTDDTNNTITTIFKRFEHKAATAAATQEEMREEEEPAAAKKDPTIKTIRL